MRPRAAGLADVVGARGAPVAQAHPTRGTGVVDPCHRPVGGDQPPPAVVLDGNDRDGGGGRSSGRWWSAGGSVRSPAGRRGPPARPRPPRHAPEPRLVLHGAERCTPGGRSKGPTTRSRYLGPWETGPAEADTDRAAAEEVSPCGLSVPAPAGRSGGVAAALAAPRPWWSSHSPPSPSGGRAPSRRALSPCRPTRPPPPRLPWSPTRAGSTTSSTGARRRGCSSARTTEPPGRRRRTSVG